MIRPITVLTFILACGSGMYLYQAKHRVHLLDQQIDQTVRQTEILRGQSRALHAEWMLLNDPDRLHRLATQYLTTLQPVAPTQFADLADLDSRLPAVAPPPPSDTAAVVASAATPAPAPEQIASEAGTETQGAIRASGRDRDGGTRQLNADVPSNPPAEPAPARSANVPSATVTVPTLPADHATRAVVENAPPADRAPRPAIAQARPTDRAPRPVIAQAVHPAARTADLSSVRQRAVLPSVRAPQPLPLWRPATRHPMIAEAAPPRYIRSEQRPLPVMRPQTAPPAEYSGSMLGMARGTSNLPRPVPLNADYNNSGG